MKPIIKRYLRLRLLDNNILLFGENSIAKNIQVNDVLTRYVSLLDGERTVSEIFTILHNEFPEITVKDVEEATEKFLNENLIEDNNENKPDYLSDEELTRYDRQLLFFSMFETPNVDRYTFQKRLKDSKVTILGGGGVGSHTLLNLACAGVGEIRIVDFDKVELSNLNRSFIFNESDIGKKKVSSLEKKIKNINPKVNYEFIDKKISSKQEILGIINGSDFAVLCADTPYLKINKWFNEACLEKNIPYSLAGCSEFHGLVGPITIPYKTSCFECQDYDQKDIFSGSDYIVRANKRRTAPSFVPIISTLASLNSLEIIKYLTQIQQPSILNKQIRINFMTMEFEKIERPRKKDCPVCGDKVVKECSVSVR
ncbi:ThiF family adenylyltransferase [Sporolactobacillus sp. KGMB 08714]|uniref:ThiF family adenylyltransferase n=1 Tax=Sporolactobacillus sp. KGMB 08714 TaxID=3064704 RepID=UPI002FBE6C18